MTIPVSERLPHTQANVYRTGRTFDRTATHYYQHLPIAFHPAKNRNLSHLRADCHSRPDRESRKINAGFPLRAWAKRFGGAWSRE